MKISRFIILCSCFTVSYICILLLLFYIVPEKLLWDIVSLHYDGFIHEPVWDDMFTSLLLIFSLILNAFFMYIVMRVTKKTERIS